MKLRGGMLDEKVKHILVNTVAEHINSAEIASQCGVGINAVRSSIRRLREGGLGIHPNRRGYVLSEFATMRDDVGFTRRMAGRRASDIMTIQAALPHITKRWKGIKDKTITKFLSGPLMSGVENLSEFRGGMHFELTEDNRVV